MAKTRFRAYDIVGTTGAAGRVTLNGLIPRSWARAAREGSLITVTATSTAEHCFVSAAWVDPNGVITVCLRNLDGAPAANLGAEFALHVAFTP